MMKIRNLGFVILGALILWSGLANAQWQVPDNAVPLGRGGGNIGFKNVPPGPTGYLWTSNGPGVAPSYQPNANVGTVTGITLQGGLKGTPNPLTTGAGVFSLDANYGGFATQNCTIAASVGSNVLTVALKDNAGADPTAASPCNINYRNPTVSAGSTASVQQTSALSINTFAAGASLGSSNGAPFRLWVVVFNNAGTNVLGLINCSTSTTVTSLNEATVVTSTAMTAGATSAGVFYTPNGTTVAAKAFRILGYVEYGSGLATAGTYVSLPTTLQIFGPGIKKPGDVVQSVSASSSTAVATANTYTSSATLPTTANGALAVAAPSFTPQSTANLIRISGVATGGSGTGNSGLVGYLAGGSTVLAISGQSIVGTAVVVVSPAVFYQGPAPTIATVYSLYVIGTSAASSNAVSGGTAAMWTGVPASRIIVDEIMG